MLISSASSSGEEVRTCEDPLGWKPGAVGMTLGPGNIGAEALCDGFATAGAAAMDGGTDADDAEEEEEDEEVEVEATADVLPP